MVTGAVFRPEQLGANDAGDIGVTRDTQNNGSLATFGSVSRQPSDDNLNIIMLESVYMFNSVEMGALLGDCMKPANI